MGLPRSFSLYRTLIEDEMRCVLSGDIPARPLLHYHLGWTDPEGNPTPGFGGKALRPTLLLLACQAVGGQTQKALPAAVALELVHNFSLIHDDIQDGDTQRRHRPTVWYLWGQPQALNTGNIMRTLAGKALERLEDAGVPVEKRLMASGILDRACLEMIEGQYLDISYESRLDITPQAYLEMIERKSAALIGCALHLGALLGDADGTTVTAFREAGRKLGLAFQVQDDVLGIWGREDTTGKPSGNDIRRKKKSYPVVVALDSAPPEARAELVALYSKGGLDEDDVCPVMHIFEKVGAQELTREKARSLKEEAVQALRGKVSPPWGAELCQMADFLVEREF